MSGNDDPPSQFVTIDDRQYCYRKRGAGPEILLLHGVTDSSRFFWREFFRHFDADYTVVAVDLPGHGDSGKSASGYSPADYAQFISKFLDKLGLCARVILGHSLGGIIAIKYAVMFPGKVTKLIICDSPLSGDCWQDLKWISGLPLPGSIIMGSVMLPGLGRLLYGMRSPQMIRRTLEHLRIFSDPSQIPTEMIREKMKATYEAVSQSLWRGVIFEDLRDDLDRVSASTLIIRGADDVLVPQEQVEEAVAKIPDSRAAVVYGAAHFPHLEQPAQFNQLVAHFLSNAPARGFQGVGED